MNKPIDRSETPQPPSRTKRAFEPGSNGMRAAWRKASLKERIEVITAIATATAALFAGGKYVFGLFSSIELELELPPVIEFRCSNYSQQAGRICMQDDRTSLTVTAALFLRARGDAAQEATVTHATVDVTRRWTPGTKQLTSFWSADFVPGQEFRRRQVTVQTIKGGEARSAEMWFFPLERACPSGSTVTTCDKPANENFIAWSAFLGELKSVSDDTPTERAAIDLMFTFYYREGKKSDKKEVPCRVTVTPKTRTAATVTDSTNPDRSSDIISVTVPCRTPDSSPKPWYDLLRRMALT